MAHQPISYNEIFFHEISRLNRAQREAIDQVEGPVLVVAGPGTGKTQILAARIGRILEQTDTEPHNILCLTFTEAAVRSMRKRLIDFIGPEAHRVHIYTFHSFCNKIIRENLEYFGRWDLEPVSDLERIEILQQLLDSLPVDHILKRGRTSDNYFYLPHLRDLFSRMKSEDWTPELIEQKAGEYLAELPQREEFIYQRSGKNFSKGDLKEALLSRETIRMEMLAAAAKLYPEYQSLMKSRHRYDFDDMILWVLEAFNKNEMLLRNYQEQYLYFLVDEFQDTNRSQYEILKHLVAYWEVPNIFIVGDDDQSIFEFQGARLQNLLDFYQEYKNSLSLVVLEENYRSSQAILDLSSSLLLRNQLRIAHKIGQKGIEKKLVASHETYAKSVILPAIYEYPTRFHEVADIVERIEKLKSEGIPLHEIAVIYAEHRQSGQLISLLEKKGIPYETKRRINILDLRFFSQLKTLIEYLVAETVRPYSGEHLLFRLLGFGFIGIPLEDLARVSLYLAKTGLEEPGKWRDIIADETILKDIIPGREEIFLHTASVINGLLRDVQDCSTLHLLERIINKSGLLRWALEQPKKSFYTQVLFTFMEFVRVETTRKATLTLSELLKVLQNMERHQIPLEMQQVLNTGESVRLLTAHSAKGLEFQCVFILDAVKDFWEPKSRQSSYRFSFPDTLTFSGEEDATEARRRLFYVAMTRAKETLVISYSNSNGGKELHRASFIDEILDAASISVSAKEASAMTANEAMVAILSENPIPQVPSPDPAIIDEILQDFALSISSLNAYIDCPIRFYYENILKVPTAKSEAAYYGDAIHGALQRFFEKMLHSKDKSFPDCSELTRLFENEMTLRRGYFSEDSWHNLLETGETRLRGYFEHSNGDWPRNVKPEYKIYRSEIEGVPVTGVIDKVEFQDALYCRVVDYKTGKVSEGRLRKPTAKNPYGGDYWRQLVFYKLLLESHRPMNHIVSTGQIVSLAPDKTGVFQHLELHFDSEDSIQLKTIIKDVWQRITNHDFFTGCGKQDCQWCSFLNSEMTVDSFSNPDIEGLDDAQDA